MVGLLSNCSGYLGAPSVRYRLEKLRLQPGDLPFQLCRIQGGVFGLESFLGFLADVRHFHQPPVGRSRLVMFLLDLGAVTLAADQFHHVSSRAESSGCTAAIARKAHSAAVVAPVNHNGRFPSDFLRETTMWSHSDLEEAIRALDFCLGNRENARAFCYRLRRTG